MTPIPVSKFVDSGSAKHLCLIIGLACLAAFTLNFLSIAFPLDPLSDEWRLGLFQQIGDRSIVLLLGTALTLYSVMGNRRLLQRVSIACLFVGVLFHLSCLLVVHDSIFLRERAVRHISEQATQLQDQLQSSQDKLQSPSNTPVTITPDQIDQAFQEVSGRAEALKQQAQEGILRTSIVSLGNLIIAGVGLVGMGRFGLKRR